MRPTFDVHCLGDALLDFLPETRGPLRQVRRFEAHLGGAVVNVAVGLARLGRRVRFQGVVGDDELGRGLADQMAREGVTPGLRFTPEAPTAFTFVGWDVHGERSFFSPLGGNGADKLLAAADVDPETIAQAHWFHCGSNTHVKPAAREALFKAVTGARQRGLRISFDPNVRMMFWPRPEPLQALCRELFPLCDVVKLSEEELELCTGRARPDDAIELLLELGASLVCVTLGPRGVRAGHRSASGVTRLSVPAPAVDVVDTTGAGDGFVSALLSRLTLTSLDVLSEEALAHHLAFACWSASRVCTFPGAVTGLARLADVPSHLL